jgi:predicted nucleic acid-binding protein
MAFASVEMIQEVLHHRLRKTSDRNQAVTQARDVATLMTLLPFDVRILDESLQLISAHPVIRGRDAVHAATAVAHGIPEIISPDPAFDGIPGLRRTFPGT